jgi:MFS family permease
MYSKAYKRYVLWLLTVVFTWNYLDRVLIALLLQPIKEDLHLSDTQLGFLTGFAFALFYATLGLPIARWADRGNRTTIISAAIALWGITVMSCLFVGNFVQLVCARIAAAVGEAGCMPPGYSLLGDYFPLSTERTRAMTVYTLGYAVGALPGFLIGGWLNERYGWRLTFFAVGAPALLFAMLVRWTIGEPRMNVTGPHGPERTLPSMGCVLTTLWCRHSCRHLIAAIILLWTTTAGLTPWYAAFMMRSHGMGTAELGLWFGLIFSIPGVAGILIGGHLATRWLVNNEQGQMRVSAAAIAGVVPCFVLFLFLPDKYHALIALIPVMVMFCVFLGPTFAVMQRLVADEIRATTLAVVMLLANLLGMGIGPQVVGSLSDVLRPAFGNDSLRYAMLTMSLMALWTAYHFWQVGRTVEQDLAVVTHESRNAKPLASALEATI